MFSRRRPPGPAPRPQGAVMVLGALALGIALSALMVLDVAHVFTQRRVLQKAADGAALAATQLVDDACSRAAGIARQMALDNGLPPAGTVSAECGRWDPQGGTAPRFFTANATPANAVRVRVERQLPYFFGLAGQTGRQLEAEATAAIQPVTTISVGSGLAAISDAGALNSLLSGLLGSAVNLSLASYQGLAAGSVRLLDLIRAEPLRLGTVDELLATNVSLGNLLLAAANAADGSQVLAINVLNALALRAQSLNVPLGQLLDVRAPTDGAALNARINLFDLLMVGAQVANKNNAVSLNAGLNLGPLAQLALTLRVIEPPQIAVGGVGASAKTAQVRLRLNLTLLSLNLGVASTSIQLPLALEVAPARATVSALRCGRSFAESQVQLSAQTGLASLCLSRAVATGSLSSPEACATSTQPAPLATINVLGLVNVGLRGYINVQAVNPQASTLVYGEGAAQPVNGGSYRVGSSLAGTLSNALRPGSLQLSLDTTGVLGLVGLIVNPILATLVPLVEGLLSTVLAAVLPLLDGVLNALGLQIGYADVNQIRLQCNQAELVY